MTELEIKENTFYVLTLKNEKGRKITLYNDMESPIRRVKEYLKDEKSPDNIELMAVEIKEDNFEIKSIPWSMIAVGLIKE